MDQVQPELTFDESVKQVMQTLPPVIRAYLAQGKYSIVAQNLMAKYGLRVDQGGVLEREIMLLLMGIDTPDEFIQALAEEAKLDEKTIAGIVQDVNAQIFVSLRAEEMKNGGMKTEPAVQQPPRAAVSTTEPPHPSPKAMEGTAKGIYAPPLQSPKYFHLENKIPAPARSINQIAKPPVARPDLRTVLATVMAPKQIDTRKMLEDHEEPHIAISDKVQGTSSPVPLTPSVKPYSADPYREPVDEK